MTRTAATRRHGGQVARRPRSLSAPVRLGRTPPPTCPPPTEETGACAQGQHEARGRGGGGGHRRVKREVANELVGVLAPVAPGEPDVSRAPAYDAAQVNAGVLAAELTSAVLR